MQQFEWLVLVLVSIIHFYWIILTRACIFGSGKWSATKESRCNCVKETIAKSISNIFNSRNNFAWTGLKGSLFVRLFAQQMSWKSLKKIKASGSECIDKLNKNRMCFSVCSLKCCLFICMFNEWIRCTIRCCCFPWAIVYLCENFSRPNCCQTNNAAWQAWRLELTGNS